MCHDGFWAFLSIVEAEKKFLNVIYVHFGLQFIDESKSCNVISTLGGTK